MGYNLRYKLASLLSPTKTSSQNLVLFSDPTFQTNVFWNHPWSSPSPHTLLKYLYHQDWNFTLVWLRLNSKPYFDAKISSHFPCSFLTSRHFHFANRTLLNILVSLIPNPPSSKVYIHSPNWPRLLMYDIFPMPKETSSEYWLFYYTLMPKLYKRINQIGVRHKIPT